MSIQSLFSSIELLTPEKDTKNSNDINQLVTGAEISSEPGSTDFGAILAAMPELESSSNSDPQDTQNEMNLPAALPKVDISGNELPLQENVKAIRKELLEQVSHKKPLTDELDKEALAESDLVVKKLKSPQDDANPATVMSEVDAEDYPIELVSVKAEQDKGHFSLPVEPVNPEKQIKTDITDLDKKQPQLEQKVFLESNQYQFSAEKISSSVAREQINSKEDTLILPSLNLRSENFNAQPIKPAPMGPTEKLENIEPTLLNANYLMVNKNDTLDDSPENPLLTILNENKKSDNPAVSLFRQKATQKFLNENTANVFIKKDFLIDETNKVNMLEQAVREVGSMTDKIESRAVASSSHSLLSSPLTPASEIKSPLIGESSPLKPSLLSEFPQGLSLKQNFTPDLAVRVQWMFKQALSTADIMMDPPEMGPLSVKVQQHNGETNILFQVSHAATKEMLDDSLPKLKAMLEQQGINLGEAQVKQEQQNSQNSKESEDKDAMVEQSGSDSELEGKDKIVSLETQTERLLDVFS